MSLEVTTPEDYIGDVIADLNSKRGKIVGVSAELNLQVLKKIPDICANITFFPVCLSN